MSKRQPKRRAGSRKVRARQWPRVLWAGAFLIAAAAAVAATHVFLTSPGSLPLRVIEVEGEFRHLRREQIRERVVSVIDGGFFTCDMRKLREEVLALPWVADVSIRRVWPDRLQMSVTEEVPLARWGDDALINVRARVFRPDARETYDGLVRLHGPEGSEARVVALLQAALPAARLLGVRIDALTLDQRRHWSLRFDDDLVVSLGGEDVHRRLAQFFRVYPMLTGQPERQPLRVDMRYAHGFAVRWKEPADRTEETMEGESA